MESTLGNERERCASLVDSPDIGTAQQRTEIHAVMGSRAIVAREDLQGDQVAEARDGNAEAGNDLDRVCRRHDLGLDPGGGEQQIDDRATDVLASDGKPDCRQPAGGVLLDRGRSMILISAA
jgi:hypothetical protein